MIRNRRACPYFPPGSVHPGSHHRDPGLRPGVTCCRTSQRSRFSGARLQCLHIDDPDTDTWMTARLHAKTAGSPVPCDLTLTVSLRHRGHPLLPLYLRTRNGSVFDKGTMDGMSVDENSTGLRLGRWQCLAICLVDQEGPLT